MLLPALSLAKAKAKLSGCAANMRQLAIGTTLYQGDHRDRFHPGAVQGASAGTAVNVPGFVEMAWDSYIRRYIGDTASTDMEYAYFGVDADNAPKVVRCPADRFPKVYWVVSTRTGFELAAVRTYSINSAGSIQGAGGNFQIGTGGLKWPLPAVGVAGQHGVGIYWCDTAITKPPWDPPGYTSAVVRDPSGTILYCEKAGGQECIGGEWVGTCEGPISSDAAQNGNRYQLSANRAERQNPASADGVNQGWLLYAAQGERFNYCFHDGHVQRLKWTDTVGRGQTNGQPYSSTGGALGMWTLTPGD
jgi:prepilin-type processing-associated H-X9-DG protein